MKLLLCRACGDIRKMHATWMSCECNRSAGRYIDSTHAEIRGIDAECLGIDNNDMAAVVQGDRAHRGEWWLMEPGAEGVRVRRVA